MGVDEINDRVLYPDIWRSTICMSAFIEWGMYHIFRGQVGCWKNKGTMTTYLQVYSVPDKVCEDLWKELQAAQVRGSKINERAFYPDIWRSTICMSAFIECGMNHIFRDVVEHCIVVMSAFMTHHNLYASFERAINPYLQELKFVGLYRKRSLWTGYIDTNKLPFCKSCFNDEVESLLKDKFRIPHIPTCGRCGQWNMGSGGFQS